MYDITSRKSFEEIKQYYFPNIKEYCKKDIKVILLGNKTDLEDKREVSPEEASIFAMENEYLFMESSCLKNTNVANAFVTLIEITNRETNPDEDENDSLQITMNKQKKTKKTGICGGNKSSSKSDETNRSDSFTVQESPVRSYSVSFSNTLNNKGKKYISKSQSDSKKKKKKNDNCVVF